MLESASGVKMWQCLRAVSDYCLLDEMNRGYSKEDMKKMPSFVQSVMQARHEQEGCEGYDAENSDPN